VSIDGVSLIHIVRHHLYSEQIHLVERLESSVSLEKRKDLSLKAIAARIFIEQRQKRVVIGLFKLEPSTQAGGQKLSEVSLPDAGYAFHSDVANSHD
jgi:hypothetical protein